MTARVTAAFHFAFALGVLLILTGCGSSQPDVGGDGKPSGGSTPSCATPNTGCSCSQSGQTVACGNVEQTSGTYVTCSEGTRTCNGGTWGDCIGTHTSTKSLSSLNTKGLGASAPCVDD